MTPEFNPNDIAGTQGGRRPLPGIPGGGGFGTGSGEPQILNGGSGYVNPSIHGGQGVASPELADVAKRAADNQWEGWDFVKQGTPQGGNPAAGKMGPGMEAQWRANNPGLALPDQSNDTPLGGLNLLANQAKKKPTRTLAQTYRPNKYGISSGIRT